MANSERQISSNAPEVVMEARQLIIRHEEGAAADAGFDAGEWSGPAHARKLEEGLDALAAKYRMERDYLEALIDHHAVRYVNAYSVSRHYGGPEEGGWWYDAGEPLASIPIRGDEDPEPHKTRLTELLGWPKKPSQGRYSVNGGEDFEVCVEDEPARRWPDRKPHYE